MKRKSGLRRLIAKIRQAQSDDVLGPYLLSLLKQRHVNYFKAMELINKRDEKNAKTNAGK